MAFNVNSYANQMPITIKPPMPYFGTIPTLTTGSLIIIHGRVPNGCRRFDINLMVGSIITEQMKTSGDIALHFNPRFDEQLVVRNTRQQNRWGPEEREPRFMPFFAGQDFEAMILVEDSGYKVAINGKHFIEYQHRIPMSCVGVLTIEGNVNVDRIEYRREMRYFPNSNPMPVINPTMTHTLQPVISPRLPFHQKFTEGLRSGFMVYISGRLNQSPDRFAIDFLNENIGFSDIAFHFGVRVRDALVVRNTRTTGQWGDEERKVPDFPFYAGVNFDLIVRIEMNRYLVAVNGQHFIEYKHRIPVQFVNGLSISGDLIIASIRFAHN